MYGPDEDPELTYHKIIISCDTMVKLSADTEAVALLAGRYRMCSTDGTELRKNTGR